MADSDPPPAPTSGAADPGSLASTAMSEAAVRALLREEVAAAMAAALRPGPSFSGESVVLMSICCT